MSTTGLAGELGELAKEPFPPEVISMWEAGGIVHLLPIQRKAIEAGCLEGTSCLIVGPTSCGKTFVGEMTLVCHALGMRSSLYLVPFKALAEEKHEDFSKKYGRPDVGARVVISTADRRSQDAQLTTGDFDIAIMTYEKLSALLVSHPGLLSRVGFLLVDEIQMVSDENRGAELELLLTRTRQVSPGLQIMGLSATVSELNGFDEWLGAMVVQDLGRPIPLREGVLTPNGRYTYVEWDGDNRVTGEETLTRVVGSNEEELAASLASQILDTTDEQLLVFANTVRNTQRLARLISGSVSRLGPAKKAKEAIIQLEDTESVTSLLDSLDSSIAFHNADLTLEERLAVETGFRDGEIRCVVSTSTLSMGVNLPASTVVISNSRKWTKDQAGSWQQVPVTVGEYQNMSGRAGRLGLVQDPFGRSVLVAKSPIEQRAYMARYVDGTPDPMTSAFLKQPLDVRLLRLVASGICRTADGIGRFLQKTFAAHHQWTTEAAKADVAAQVDQAMEQLVSAALIAREGDRRIVATPLGMICAASGLDTHSFQELIRLCSCSHISAIDVGCVASTSKSAGADALSLRFSTEEYNLRTRRMVQGVREICAQETAPITEVLVEDLERRYPDYGTARSLKYQLIAYAYVSGTPTREIENRFVVPAGRIRGIGSMCSWLSDTAARVAWAQGLPDRARECELLAERFLHGCSAAAVALAQLPVRIHRGDREKLVLSGYHSLQKIAETSPESIAKNAKVQRASVVSLQECILKFLGESLSVERQQIARLKSLGVAVEPLEWLYTTTGTMLEQAIEGILVAPFCPLTVSRVTKQREGEADLRILLTNGANGIAQVTAKESLDSRVGMRKAGAVLQQSPELKPVLFVCFGRPDFDDTAMKKAEAHAKNTNYKAIPIKVLAEMYLRYHEGKLAPERVREIIEDEVGYISMDRI